MKKKDQITLYKTEPLLPIDFGDMPPVEQFAYLMSQGVNCIYKAGQVLVAALEAHPNLIHEICDAYPMYTYEFVKRVEAVGRHALEPALLVMEQPGARRLRSLPMQTQTKCLAEGVGVLVCQGDNNWEMTPIDVQNLTTGQASQAIGPTGIRSEGEQRAYLLDQETRRIRPATPTESTYEVRKGTLIVHGRCTLSRKELVQVLAAME